MSIHPLPRTFYERPTLLVAEELIGKHLIHKTTEGEFSGKIVEVEAYKGPEDRASHTFGNRRTDRNEAMFGPAGHAYVYISYGMHQCMNCVTVGEGSPEGILIRALEPRSPLDLIAKRRFGVSWNELTPAQQRNTTNGPGKLTQAFGITREADNKRDLTDHSTLFVVDLGDAPSIVGTTRRIGIDHSGEAVNYPWRFYEHGNPFVLKKHLPK
ncbi:DNA-3-methyladenine glycosylase [Aureibacillus halotolerans]|uniref:Putative 3-methyladenine DNA glycosylase n=1 Tax=Aureibacillus halotolerans TaxID=1508390 RepID=A0A4V3D672_9BACI|nr:DNA-3-methyladenine glycosylase [Aureibacillus halotolerans]TDQ42617.1 DNA-3-methyladenine glycosylase [Aureibacillus halotolerans]